MCVCVCVCVWMHVYIYIYIYIFICKDIFIYMCVCMCVYQNMEEAHFFTSLQKFLQYILKRTMNIQAIYTWKFLHP